ncbi:MAG: YfhO family protein [bacterium]
MQKYKRYLPFLFIIVVNIIFFSPFIFRKVIFYYGDLEVYFYPQRFYFSQVLRRGFLPLWYKDINCGTPFYINPQFTFLYPFNSLLTLLPFALHFNFFIIFHLVLATIFFYLLLRHWQFSITASLGAAFIFNFCEITLSLINVTNLLQAVTWLPLILIFFDKAITSLNTPGNYSAPVKKYSKFFIQQKPQYIILTSISLTLQFFCGAPEISYWTLVILFFWGIISGILKKKFIRHFSLVSTVFILFLFLGCVQIFPSMEYFYQCNRKYDPPGINKPFSFNWSTRPLKFISMLFPNLNKSTNYFSHPLRPNYIRGYYLGIVGLFFCLISLFMKDKKIYWGFLVATIFYLLALGPKSSIYINGLIYKYTPFLKAFQFPEKYIIFSNIILIIIIAYTLDYWLNSVNKSHLKKLFFTSMLISPLLVITIYYQLKINKLLFPSLDMIIDNHAVYHTTIFLILLIILTYLYIKKIFSRRGYQVILLLLIIADLLSVHVNFYFPFNYKILDQRPELVNFLKKDTSNSRYLNWSKDYYRQGTTSEITPTTINNKSYGTAMSEISQEKIISSNKMSPEVLKKVPFFPSEFLYPCTGSIYNLECMSGGGSSYLKEYARFATFGRQLSIEKQIKLLGEINTKYIIVNLADENKEDKALLDEANGLKLVKVLSKPNGYSKLFVYQVEDCLPRAYIVPEAIFMEDQKLTLKTIASKEFDPRKTVIINDYNYSKYKKKKLDDVAEDRGKGKGDSHFPYCKINLYENNYIKIMTNSPFAGYLFLSDTNYPGWRAYVDGRFTDVLNANCIFRAVYVPKGEHEVIFRFIPMSLVIGGIISLVTVIAIIVTFVCLRCFKNKESG